MEVSKRLKQIPPYVFAQIDQKRQALVAQGIDVINLGIGDPDGPTPSHIVETAKQALDNPVNHHYPPFGGMMEYKEAISSWFSSRFNVNLNPKTQITSLIGSKEGLHNTIMAYIDSGDLALIPDPAYPVYRTSTILAGGETYFMNLSEENDFLPDLEAIPQNVLNSAKLMLLNYPNNPTAAIADLAFFEKVIHLAKKHDILIAHDLAYSEMTFDNYKAPSILEVKGANEYAIELHSLSKTYNMTGWRIGFLVGNENSVKAIASLKSNVDTDIFKVVQLAAIKALTGPMDHIQTCNDIYVSRRNLAINELKKLGWGDIKPNKATFYMWLKVPKSMTSADFCTKMLEEAHIVVPPGTAYGPYGEGYFRISLCVSEARLKEAFARMKAKNIYFDNTSVASR